MIDTDDFEIGDVIELLPSAKTYADGQIQQVAVVLGKVGAKHLRVRFKDGRVEDHEASMALLMTRPLAISPQSRSF